jgi:hypothetical protein
MSFGTGPEEASVREFGIESVGEVADGNAQLLREFGPFEEGYSATQRVDSETGQNVSDGIFYQLNILLFTIVTNMVFEPEQILWEGVP